MPWTFPFFTLIIAVRMGKLHFGVLESRLYTLYAFASERLPKLSTCTTVYLHAFGSLVLNTVDVVHSPEEGLVSVSVSKLVLLKEP